MMNTEIEKLAQATLSYEEIAQINEIIDCIENGNREKGVNELAGVLGIKPKRPLYYIAQAISQLPEYGTRDIIRYSGDYIDQLVRFTLEDKRFLSKWFKSSLGPNIGKLKKFIATDYYENLVLFNKIYTQAKHEFNHREQKRLFSLRDAVYVIFITKNLAKKLLEMSETARDYNNQGPTAYRYKTKD